MRARALLAALALAGCGSELPGELPPAAQPARSPPLRRPPAGRVVHVGRERVAFAGHGATTVAATANGRLVAVLSPRGRFLTVYDAVTRHRVGRLPAGIGPTHVIVRGNDAFVADTQGGTLLVFRLRPRLEFARRANLRGAPYGMALDGARLWVTLTARNEVVEVTADERPRVLRRLPSVRQPNRVAVRAGEVAVIGRDAGALQLIDPSDG